ncbi:histidine phosphatase family protein [[Mycobacterium] kokjensenii]|uniref:Histidine phosphatase family protein n=1 Tax=[Mycobacterium] kokjensenii TaxID=3064287 RepID=A0ABN9N9L4_9MYCO|nr:histidine phosphatase family protein [Mycolicibacter sp. MU0083]CAJ1500991.1 histidine phosphatase family protein [Mycolicibacter sp. MU0083]
MHQTRPWVTAGVALVGAGVLAATPVAPIAAPLPAPVLPGIQLTAVDMVLDLVRHGQSEDNVSGIIGTTPPGAPLTDLGWEQAAALADPDNPQHLQDPDFYNGIYASGFIRPQETAEGWLTAAGAPDTPVTVLPGLNEVNAGILEGTNQSDQMTALMYLVAPLAWMFGQYWVPQLGSTIDPNGMAFQDRFGGAVDQIYANGGDVGEDGDLHNVAFAHALSIATWVMMNVKNPDFGLFFSSLTAGILPNTGQVVIEGNPTDGWTLVSWNGEEVSETPSLLSGLIVDFRDLITAPQMAGWHIMTALQGGDLDEIGAALQAGFTDVFNAIAAFPQAVIDTITGSMGDLAGGDAGDAMGDLLAILAG